jgi:hypothetical protein
LNWDYLEKAKRSDQKRRTGDLESILEAISQREDQRPEDYTFATKPRVNKKDWAILLVYHYLEAGVDLNSSAYYSLKDGRSLIRQEALGNAREVGGYVIYIPNDIFASTWKGEAVNESIGADQSSGMTMQQILLQEGSAKDRTCVTSRPVSIKVTFIKIVVSHLRNNTPSPLEGEDSRSFLTRRSQLDMSVRQLLLDTKSMIGYPKKNNFLNIYRKEQLHLQQQ